MIDEIDRRILMILQGNARTSNADIARAVSMLAGSHLFDPASGDYNFPFLARYLPGMEVTVVNLAIRHQGLIVAPGNPMMCGS